MAKSCQLIVWFDLFGPVSCWDMCHFNTLSSSKILHRASMFIGGHTMENWADGGRFESALSLIFELHETVLMICLVFFCCRYCCFVLHCRLVLCLDAGDADHMSHQCWALIKSAPSFFSLFYRIKEPYSVLALKFSLSLHLLSHHEKPQLLYSLVPPANRDSRTMWAPSTAPDALNAAAMHEPY